MTVARSMSNSTRTSRSSAPRPTRRPPADRGRGRAVALAAVGALSLSACARSSTGGAGAPATPSALPQGSEQVKLDPADFTVKVTNKYWPMKPGDRYAYEEKDWDGTVTNDVVTVLDQTEKVNGVETLVVHDLATRNGVTIEDTTDWYAQDSQGNLWYFGEQTTEFKDGQPGSTEGSWKYGEGGAQAGIALPATPAPGVHYRQEYRKGEAQDQAMVLSTNEQVQTPTGLYHDALLPRAPSPLKPARASSSGTRPESGPS